MGEAFRSLAIIVRRLLEEHRPDVVAVSMPFIGRFITPVQLIPVMAFPCRIQELADEAGIRFMRIHEPDARRAFLGAGQTPRKSKDIKRAIMEACRLRDWPATDNHAADALCVADFVLNQIDPSRSHERTPLFLSAGLARAKARKEAV
jgi:Holliday junction resolvasome RuvABC endonuclease subunit